MHPEKNVTKEWIGTIIAQYLADPKVNRLSDEDPEPAFGEPLVGYCPGDDPIFEEIKAHIGSFYWKPAEIFEKTFLNLSFSPQDLTVVAWILPQTRETKAEHRHSVEYPGKRWSLVRRNGEVINEGLRRYLVTRLAGEGIFAVAPALSPFWERRDSQGFGYASTWSERHAAFACGLGTFGLSDGLITPAGKAVRIGSVVAMIDIEADPRPYADHHAYCLYYNGKKCGKCMDRCPAGAITDAGHDKVKCKAYIRDVTSPYVEKHQLGVKVNSCGLCQVKVPCESGIPVREEE